MIAFHQVSKRFAGKLAVRDVTFTVEQGEFTVLVGTSGSGKSTTLKMINRLITHDAGTIHVAGEDIGQLNPQQLRRRMGYAIQSVGLFPHWTVARNIATVPTLLNWPAAEIQRRVTELLALLNLDESFAHRYPHQLSGGQQQRVGVARALAADPDVLLMDEPFGALDPVTRATMQQEIIRIHRLSGRTIVLVTHDIDEALTLADKIVLMDDGQIVQQGKPVELLLHPATPFVSDFFGRAELGLRLLSLGYAGAAARRGEWLAGEPVTEACNLREALSLFIARQTDRLPVVDKQQQPLGVLHFSDLLRQREGG